MRFVQLITAIPAFAILTSGFALAQESRPSESRPDDLAPLIARLVSPDAAVRDAAPTALQARGGTALPALRSAWKETADPEFKVRIAAVVRSIEAALADKVTIELVVPPTAPTLAELNGGKWKVIARITNGNPVDVLISPFMSLRVRDAHGADVKPSRKIGRSGRRAFKCFPQNVTFKSIPAGKSIDVDCAVDSYTHDSDFILGWKLPAAGEYTLSVGYDYSRAALIGRCKVEDCAGHDDPDRPWNQALEFTRALQTKVTVKE